MNKIVLNGITWNHSRGIMPLLATSQRFSELHSEVVINWDKRSLQKFADYPIEKLAAQYDLLIIDHPWVGCAAATKCVLPLDEYLSKAYLKDQLDNSVGSSHLSYYYEGHQWALAIDAAAPVASYRADLFEKDGRPVPKTWQDVIALGQRGNLAVPSTPVDLLMHFYMCCLAHNGELFLDKKVVDRETGLRALHTMKELWSLVDKKMFTCNPIAIAEIMTSTDDYWYCPFAYGYSNYSRGGFTKYRLTCTDLVVLDNSKRLISTLGGTGLSVSAVANHPKWAIEFAAWVVSPDIQSTLYVQSGGQPGHRSAWINEEVNIICNNFFINTLSTLNRSYKRPRYNGYLLFQDHAGISLQKYLLRGGKPERVLEEMNILYQSSKQNINI